MINLGDQFPDFTAKSTHGEIHFHEWLNNSWAILFSHPADFTPVCTTELGKVVVRFAEFDKRGVKVIALSCDDVESHKGWIPDIQALVDMDVKDFPYPIISDPNRDIAVKLGMIDPDEKDSEGMPLTCRAVFIIGPDKRLKLSMLYPATTGRNFDEVLRCIDSLQLTENRKVATPANWQPGDDVMVLPTVKDEDIPSFFPKGVRVEHVPSGRNYIRITPQP